LGDSSLVPFVKEVCEMQALSLRKLCDVVLLLERRLQAVEQSLGGDPELAGDLQDLECRINAIKDEAKRRKAMDTFLELCELLGIKNLEEE
jgi:hypothetical protein